MSDTRKRCVRHLMAGTALAGTIVVAATAADAVVIEKTYVGTLSNILTAFGQNPANNPGAFRRGGKYVVKARFDTDDLVVVPAAGRIAFTADTLVVPLTDAPGSGGNTYQLFLPSEGFGEILTQTGQDHFAIGAGFAPTAEIQFFASCNSVATCDANFRGFEFESNFIRANSPIAPDPTGDVVFEHFTADVTPAAGITATNHHVNILDGNLNQIIANAGTTDVLSQDPGPSGGQQNPGVFFDEAVPVIGEAGPALTYSASSLSVTTDGGTALLFDVAAPIVPGAVRQPPSVFDDQPRQADNDLGAARTDGEDFLTFQWSIDGGPLQAADQPGERLDRIVGAPAGEPAQFLNVGTRTVDDVNITVPIQSSGLQSTIDTVQFAIAVTEELTGIVGSGDTATVSYVNAGPAADAGPNVVFDAANLTRTADGSVTDPDLAVNALIPGFETHTFLWERGGTTLGTAEDLVLGIAQSGLTSTTGTAVLDFTATDLAGAPSSDTTMVSYLNAAPLIGTRQVMQNLATGAVTLVFDLNDDDFVVNGLIASFEELMYQLAIGGNLVDSQAMIAAPTGFNPTFDLAALTTLCGGLGPCSGQVDVTDRAGAADLWTFDFIVDVEQVPAPATALMLGVGLLGLGAAARRRARGT